jgi:1-deoxy-D-xylulose-5-phosphate reductoisomerase
MKEEKKKKGIAVLGSTGSIGVQALDVIKKNPDEFMAEVLTANSNAELLITQALTFEPNAVVIADESKYSEVKSALEKTDIKVFAGKKSLEQVVEMSSVDMVLTAMVGYSGLAPTIAAIKAGKDIALANKETLVVAGELITALCKQYGVNIYPVDSEHSAIFQCIVGEFHNPIEKIILTASGGPFRGKSIQELQSVSKAQALKHPNWSMGAKITIDSATMMNKGLEVIEAKWLFGLQKDQIEVIVHPQSIIHSMVQFADGSIKAQMGLPDMRLPIQFALGFPNRLKSDFERFDFTKYPSLTFEKPDLDTFRNLDLAYHALDKKGNAACVLNAANEITVQAFLEGKISFTDIQKYNETAMGKMNYIHNPDLQALVQTDEDTRNFMQQLIQKK